MRKYDVALFDLDGTIADSGVGVTNGAMYALEKFGIQVKSREELYKFIGPPLVHSFKMFYGFSDEDAARAAEYFREYYNEKGLFECYVYDGIKELLIKLKKEGVKLSLATSKVEKFAYRVLDFLGILEFFDYVSAAGDDDKLRSTKEEVVDYALRLCGVADVSKVVMIGDRHFDINGARKFGIDSIGVTFGYGSPKELKESGATYVVDTPADIAKIIL